MPEVIASDLETLLMCMMRYAMGRTAFITDEADRLVREYWQYTTLPSRLIMSKDLEAELTHNAENHTVLGSYGDHKVWIALLTWMKTTIPKE